MPGVVLGAHGVVVVKAVHQYSGSLSSGYIVGLHFSIALKLGMAVGLALGIEI